MLSNPVEKQNFFLSCKESRIENEKNFYGCFYIGPFNSGQSLTVANTLRRILLSEIHGIAITSVIIEGATHEYSTLPGIQDSILDIILNLKEIILKSRFPLKEPVYAYIENIGPGVVRACDIKFPFFIQCVDPNQYIATLSENTILKIKLIIQEGKNYQIYNYKQNTVNLEKAFLGSSTEETQHNFNSDKLKKTLEKKNQILLDAVFMPVNKVNYTIETYQSTNSHLNSQVIILEIWTNGSLTPRQALYLALNHSNNLFSQLQKMKVVNALSVKSLLWTNT